MPRKSAASLTVVAPKVSGRHPAPMHLTPAAKAIWSEVIVSEEPDHFDRAGMRQLLERYCELTATLRTFEAELAETTDLEFSMRLAKLTADLGGRAATIAQKLRLTPAARERVTPKRSTSPYEHL